MSLWGAWEQPRTLGHIPLLFSSLEWASSFFLSFFTCHSCQAQWRGWWWWRWVAAAPIPFFSSPKLHPTVPSGAEEDNAQTVTSTLLSGKKVGLSSEHPPLIHRHGVTAPRRADCVCVCVCVWGLISATQRESRHQEPEMRLNPMKTPRLCWILMRSMKSRHLDNTSMTVLNASKRKYLQQFIHSYTDTLNYTPACWQHRSTLIYVAILAHKRCLSDYHE